MKTSIGCNTLYPAGRLTSEGQFTLPHQLRALEVIAEAGFDAVEFSHAGHLTPEELQQVAAHARALGLVPWSVHAWRPLAATAADVETTLADYRVAAQTAHLLGVRVVVVHSGGTMAPAGLSERRSANSECLRALAEWVGPKVVVAVENMSARADWEFIIELVDACPLPNVGLNLDTGHAHLGDLGVVNAIRMAGGRVRTTHLQDNLGQQDNHLPPGQGTIRWEEALAAFREVGYTGCYLVELSDCPIGREPDTVGDTRRAAENLRALLAQAGIDR